MREVDHTIELAEELGRTTRADPRAGMDDLSHVPETTKIPKGVLYVVRRGRWKRECPDKKKFKTPDSANVVAESKEPLILTVSTQYSKDEWLMDSGCSFHITPDKSFLFDLEEFKGGKVLMANNTHNNIHGIGKIRILNSDGSMVILTGVRYIPGMSRNLISYGMLETSGCRYEGKDLRVNFYKDDKKVISGKYHQGLYYLQGTESSGEANLWKVEKNMTNV